MARKKTAVKTTRNSSVTANPALCKVRKRYNQTQVYDALKDINEGMSVKSAAKKWMIPRTTLNDLKLGHYKPEARPGPATILSATEEQLLEEWIIEMSRRGLPLSRNNVMDSIQRIINDDGRSTPFKDGRPGSTWYKLFLQRHPCVTERYAESISRSRGALTEGCIRGWFDDAKKFFGDKGIEYVLHDPTRQYNGDETGFRLDPKSGKVLGPKSEQMYSESGGAKEQMSVLITTRADGKVMTTAIVYPYKRNVPKAIVTELPKGFTVAKSDSGWMTSSIFFEYLANTFIPELAKIRKDNKNLAEDAELILDDSDWIVFWIDGYSSHLTMHTSQLCEANKIVLYCFKAHSSHICQPNDVGPFKPLKQEWRNAVADWRLGHPYAVLSKFNFANVLFKAIQNLNPEAVIAGYRNTGLFPFNVDAVSFHRLTATNQSKFDKEAFGEQCATQEECQSALKIMEVILGDQVVNVYKEVENMPCFDYDVLPNINAYLVWKQVKLLFSGEISTPLLRIERCEEDSTLMPIPNEPQESRHIDVSNFPWPMNEHNSDMVIDQTEFGQMIDSIVEPHQPSSPTTETQLSCDDATAVNSPQLSSNDSPVEIRENLLLTLPIGEQNSKIPKQCDFDQMVESFVEPHQSSLGLPASVTLPSCDDVTVAHPPQLSSNVLCIPVQLVENELLMPTFPIGEQNSEIRLEQCDFDQIIDLIVEPHQPFLPAPVTLIEPSCDDVTVVNSSQLSSNDSPVQIMENNLTDIGLALSSGVHGDVVQSRSGLMSDEFNTLSEIENTSSLAIDAVVGEPGRPNNSPVKIKRGVPHWFKGTVSPAFEQHIFWPSPPKKKTTFVHKQLFPACASSSEWRALYREKENRKKKTSRKTTKDVQVCH
jgi:DDE superfamily endonuclease